jgi:hypothetical protein
LFSNPLFTFFHGNFAIAELTLHDPLFPLEAGFGFSLGQLRFPLFRQPLRFPFMEGTCRAPRPSRTLYSESERSAFDEATSIASSGRGRWFIALPVCDHEGLKILPRTAEFLLLDARERLADPLLLLGDLEPVKSPAEPMVCGLSPGGRWIRTFGSPTDPPRFRDSSPDSMMLTLSRPGTDSSNPSPSSGEPVSLPNPLLYVKNPGFPRGCARLARRAGRQRRARCVDAAPTGGNISVEPYSSTAVP